ncbi:hypothetical protein AVEN_156253-1 [Araneus ventricosus]|uniref:Uncharacterized protein n=1 Tax=Araneus ventricosus TaxID=182803 RepID=A0A4Y2ERG1_ARAVE|nr:hypothetical protein AVEN_156253-1 [Araneus ventricosus]
MDLPRGRVPAWKCPSATSRPPPMRGKNCRGWKKPRKSLRAKERKFGAIRAGGRSECYRAGVDPSECERERMVISLMWGRLEDGIPQSRDRESRPMRRQTFRPPFGRPWANLTGLPYDGKKTT